MKQIHGTRIAFIGAILVCTLGVTAVFAEGSITLAIKDLYNNIQGTTLQKSVDAQNVTVQENALRDAKKDANDASLGGTFSQAVANLILKEVNPLVAKANLDAAKLDVAANLRTRQTSTYEAVQRLLLANERLKEAKAKQVLTAEEFGLTKSRFDAGLISAADLRDAQYTVDSGKQEVKKLELALESAKLTAKDASESDLTADIALSSTDSIAMQATFYTDTIDVEAALKKATASSSDLFQKTAAIGFAEKRLSLAGTYFKAGDTTYDNYKWELDKARMGLSDAQRSYRVSVLGAMNDLLNARDNLANSRDQLKLQQDKKITMEEKLKTGLIGRLEMISMDRLLLDAELDILAKLVDCNLAEIHLRNQMWDELPQP